MIALQEKQEATEALIKWVRAETAKRTSHLEETVKIRDERIAVLEKKVMTAPAPLSTGFTAEQLGEMLLTKVLGKFDTSVCPAIVGDRRGVVTIKAEPAPNPVPADPANHGKPWSDADEAKVIRLYRFGLSLPELAQLFGRYEDAIVLRLYSLMHARPTLPAEPDTAWYAHKRRIFFSSEGMAFRNPCNGLLATPVDTGWAQEYYADCPHVLAAFDQPVYRP